VKETISPDVYKLLTDIHDSINFNLVWQTALEAPELQSKITELLSSVEVS